MAMTKDISDVKIKLEVMGNDIKYIKKALDGNGEPGLVHDTRTNTDFRIASETKTKITHVAIGSGWILVIGMLVLQMLGVL